MAAARLRCVEHVDDLACTIFSMDVTIAGLLRRDDGRWLWELFVLPDPGAERGEASPFRGVAATRELALAAVEDRWIAWLQAAGLAWLSVTQPQDSTARHSS
jgi:hypothetical protein